MAKRFEKLLTFLFVIFILFSSVLGFGKKQHFEAKCEQMNVEQCQFLRYNMTGIPNIFGDNTQTDVERRLTQITELLTSTCAEPVRFFFCSMYAPMCSKETNSLITACGSLCEYVTGRCKPIAKKFNIEWLEEWNCSRFYWKNNKDEMCMEGPFNNFTRVTPSVQTSGTISVSNDERTFKNPHSYKYSRRRGVWILLCEKDGIFTSDDREFAEMWMTVWSIICFVSTTFAILSFLMESKRYRYPERAIVMLTICYNLYCVGFIIRVIVGYQGTACSRDKDSDLYLTQNEFGNPHCAVVFLFLYFFGMAACIWWVILALTWFLAAGMQWSYEAIDGYSNIFHAVAWFLPVVKTVVVLILRKVDGDELTGLCYVGNQDSLALTGFVLGPQFTYLITGVLFLLAGFIAVYRFRLNQRKQHLNGVEKFDIILDRIGIFSTIIGLPAACVIAVHFYEYSSRERWTYGDSQPIVTVLMLKICMSFFAGFLCSAWLWTCKVTVALKRFYMMKFQKRSASDNSSNNNIALRNLTMNGFQTDTEV